MKSFLKIDFRPEEEKKRTKLEFANFTHLHRSNFSLEKLKKISDLKLWLKRKPNQRLWIKQKLCFTFLSPVCLVERKQSRLLKTTAQRRMCCVRTRWDSKTAVLSPAAVCVT